MKSEQNKNIFHSFPPSFFNALTGMNRELIQLSLSALYEATRNGTSYTMTYDAACEVIEDILSYYAFDVESEEEKLNSDHDKALFILRRLRSCGWITEEIGENYERFLHFEDYAVELLHTVKRVSDGETEEYSGYIYTIYQLLRSVEPLNGDIALERVVSNTEDLFRQLASLNTNIKKYIQRLLDRETKENLQALMGMLLKEYQEGIVDRAYYNLTTRDNPEKFREYILTRIALIREDSILMDSMARQRMERKASGYEESYKRILTQLDYVESSFNSIDGLMTEIDRKNHKYIVSALARITFLLEAHEDLEGKINRILKALIAGTMDPDALFQLYRTTYLDEESLYTLKKKRLKVKQSFAENEPVDESALLEFAEVLAQEQKFSRSSVEHHMLELLGEKKEVTAGQVKIEGTENFTFLVLGYLYGHDEGSALEITDTEVPVNVNGYRFYDFVIRRSGNG